MIGTGNIVRPRNCYQQYTKT